MLPFGFILLPTVFPTIFPNCFRDKLDASVKNCVDCYTSDWVVVKRRYQHHSSSVQTRADLDIGQDENLPRQEFEYDDSPEASPDVDNLVSSRILKNGGKLLHYQTDLKFAGKLLQ
jgi:hypothetical protein